MPIIAQVHGRGAAGGQDSPRLWPARGLENPDALIGQLIEAGADALVVLYGTLKRSGHLLHGCIPVIARIDGGPSAHTGVWREYADWRLLFDVEDAAALGADAVVVMHFVGAPVEMDMKTWPRRWRSASAPGCRCWWYFLTFVGHFSPCKAKNDLQR